MASPAAFRLGRTPTIPQIGQSGNPKRRACEYIHQARISGDRISDEGTIAGMPDGPRNGRMVRDDDEDESEGGRERSLKGGRSRLRCAD